MKRNLFLLLLLPFLLALLGIVGVNATVQIVDNAVASISFLYEDYAGFDLTEGDVKLEATARNAAHYVVPSQNSVRWSVANADEGASLHARVIANNGVYYLRPLSEGLIKVSCYSKDRSVSESFTGVVYQDQTIIIKPHVARSSSRKDETLYVGTRDWKDGQKVEASYPMDFVCLPSQESLYVADCSANIAVDLASSCVHIREAGPASFTLHNGKGVSRSFSFEAVEAVNVYTYEELLACTNKSEHGEPMALQRSFVSSLDLSLNDKGNAALFGGEAGEYDFRKDIYAFPTTYDSSYIEEWNAFASEHADLYAPISGLVKAGLHVQQNVYGNGHCLNFHSLAYPYRLVGKTQGDVTVYTPYLTEDNLFRGPLPFYALGDPNGDYLISVFGQDNVGLYVEGDDILLDDLHVKNCDDVVSLSFLADSGTVIEAKGHGIRIENCSFGNGKNVARAFSSGVSFSSCQFQNAQNFLLYVGANEFAAEDYEASHDFVGLDGQVSSRSLSEALAKDGCIDAALNAYLLNLSSSNKEAVKKSLLSYQEAVNDASMDGQYKGQIEVADSSFYSSGVASIGVNARFNGPYMLTGSSPSYIQSLMERFNVEVNQKALIPLIPTDVGGSECPVHVSVTGHSRFYDYKDVANMDISGLLSENVTGLVGSLLGNDEGINGLFPIVNMVHEDAKDLGYVLQKGETDYLCIPVAYYGGGYNGSKVEFSTDVSLFSEDRPIDLLEQYLEIGNGYFDRLKKIVTTCTGYTPFQFVYCQDTSCFVEA